MATATTTKATGINELRAEYRRMRDAGRFVFGREWDAAVIATLAKHGIDPSEATPLEWVGAAEATTLTYERCHGDGLYKWGGTVNGKPVHTGTCHHCGGSGTQDLDDMFRNKTYVLYAIVQAVRWLSQWAFTDVVAVLVLRPLGVPAHSPMDRHWSF